MISYPFGRFLQSLAHVGVAAFAWGLGHANTVARAADAPLLPSPEAIVALTSVETVTLSPDGRHVAYLLGRESHRAGAEVRELWVVNTTSDGGAPTSPRRLLARTDHVAEVRWSPDGARLALIAALEHVRTLLLLDLATGVETTLAENLPGAANLQWSPDGRAVSFTRRDAVPGNARPDKNAPVALGAPSRPVRIWCCDVATRELRALTPTETSIGRYAWSPASDALVAATTPPEAWLAPHDTITIFPVASGASAANAGARPALPAPPRVLFTAHDQTIALAWSPDGKTIAWCGREHAPYSGQFILAAADGGTPPRTVQKNFPGSAEMLCYRPDGRIAFAALVGLRAGLYSLATDGGDLRTEHAPERAAPGSFGSGSFTTLALSFSADGSRIATTVSGPREPANVVTGPWQGKLERVTQLNPEVAAWSIGTVEDLAWAAPDGLALQGLLLKPPGFDSVRKYPLVVELHGGPRRSWWATSLLTDNTWAAFLASRGYVVLLPNPRGSEGRGAEFVRMNTNDLGGADFRDAMSGVDHVLGLGFTDPARLGVAGWSYGGFLSAWAVTQTPRFGAAVVGAGITNWLSREGAGNVPGLWGRLHWLDERVVWTRPQALFDRSPVTHARHVRTPTLLLYGGEDNKVPPGQGAEFYNALRSFGTPVEAYLYPGAGHAFTDPAHKAGVLRKIEAWFARWLAPPAARYFTVGISAGADPAQAPSDPARFGDFARQVRTALARVDEKLASAGLARAHLVRLDVYLAPGPGGAPDPAIWETAARTHFGPSRPALETHLVPALSTPGLQVVVEAEAAYPAATRPAALPAGRPFAPVAPGGARLVDGMVVSGGTPLSTRLLPAASGADTRAQAAAILQQLAADLAARGGSLADVVRVRAHLAPPGPGLAFDFAGWNVAFEERFAAAAPSHKPARTSVGRALALEADWPAGALVRLEVVQLTR